MEADALETLALYAAIASSVSAVLLVAFHLWRWALEEWRLAGPRAMARLQRKIANQHERQRHRRDMWEMHQEDQLTTYGRRLMADMCSRLLRSVTEVSGELRTVRTSLHNYANVCFGTLRHMASSLEGLTESPYELADLAPERRQTQLQVLAIAAAGLQTLTEVTDEAVVDSTFIAWKLNLRKMRSEICPNCPVVADPERYSNACPVMLMTREPKGEKDDEKQ